MIISPTRELAIQIFDVLRKIGKYGHLFAAGLVIGGKGLAEEREALTRMNIVVCTPGRMLQHLSQTAMFAVDSLRMLVLDEADRIMDMGFQRDVDAIIEYLPPAGQRQTLLFSATQTKRVSDLARLSLKDPEYISAHESSSSATPASLQQNYTITTLPDKLSTLYSFLISAKKSKLLIFLSSGKQVRYIYEAFRHLQPGIPLLHLHGRQKQTARLDITTRFAQARHVALFATDVAARGLDFPAVDWVVQVDCPEDADTYIHRVGRTARYSRAGRAILFLDPSEEPGFIQRLEQRKVPVERIGVRAKKQKSIQPALQGLCFKFPELKYLGQKAFVSYVRSLHVQKDKEVFGNLDKYDLAGFANSMGLPGAPRIKFTKGDAEARRALKNAPRRGMSPLSSDDDPDNSIDGAKSKDVQKVVRTKYDRIFQRQNQDVLAPHYTAMLNEDPADEKDNVPSADLLPAADNEDDLFAVKSRFQPTESKSSQPPPSDQKPDINVIADSKRKQKLLRTKVGAAKLLHAGTRPRDGQPASNRLVFDEETGEMKPPQVWVEENEADREAKERERVRNEFLEKEMKDLSERDKLDKGVAKEKRRAKKEKRKARERGERKVDGDGGEGEVEGEDDGPGLEVQERPFEDLADLYGSEDDGSNSGSRSRLVEADDVGVRSKKRLRRGTEADAPDSEGDEDLGDLEQAALTALG